MVRFGHGGTTSVCFFVVGALALLRPLVVPSRCWSEWRVIGSNRQFMHFRQFALGFFFVCFVT